MISNPLLTLYAKTLIRPREYSEMTRLPSVLTGQANKRLSRASSRMNIFLTSQIVALARNLPVFGPDRHTDRLAFLIRGFRPDGIRWIAKVRRISVRSVNIDVETCDTAAH